MHLAAFWCRLGEEQWGCEDSWQLLEATRLPQSVLTRIHLSQEPVLLHHPDLLMGSTFKLQLQEVSGALIEQGLCALEPEEEMSKSGLRKVFVLQYAGSH